MPKTLNILSIDFDYFQNPTPKNLITDYPDGIDLPTELSKPVWATHYANPACEQRLMKIQPLKNQLNTLYENLHKHTNRKTLSSIHQSHIHAYQFVIHLLRQHPECREIHLYNIDMHHDLWNDNNALDCGNWLGFLKEKLKNQPVKLFIHWICNPVSLNVYDIQNLPQETDHLTTELNSIHKKHWHGIFLCRSNQWVPPHLDQEFLFLAYTIKDRTTTVHIDPDVMKSRYDTEFQTACRQIRSYLLAFQPKVKSIRTEENPITERKENNVKKTTVTGI